jgi:hypothetical protein
VTPEEEVDADADKLDVDEDKEEDEIFASTPREGVGEGDLSVLTITFVEIDNEFGCFVVKRRPRGSASN